MKNFFKSKTAFLIICLLFALFLFLFFIIADLAEANVGTWLGFTFICIAFVAMGSLSLLLTLKSRNSMTTIWPIMYATTGYFAVSLIANLIIMLVNGEGTTGPLVINITLIILYAVLLVISFKSFTRVEDNTVRRETRVAQLRELSIKVNALTFLAKDENVKKAIKALKEDIDYSSSAGTEATASYEAQLADYVVTIQTILTSGGDAEAAIEAIETMKNILKVRNQMLMVSRK